MGKYQQTLLLVMEINDYYCLPNYPFESSLDEYEESKEIENYCYSVLQDLDSLVECNK